MGKAKGKHRLDKYYRLAKEQGYRSRASFKIVQLDAKYKFLNSARSLLDLCAAPGGWMQIAVKRMPVGSLIIGVDLVPIRPIRGAHSLQEDITTPKCRTSIRKLMKDNGHNMVDVVLHDGSPNIGGAWAKEATAQNSLVVDALKLAVDFLAPKGTFVSKVFRSQDYNALLYCFKQLFEKVEVTKPDSSRQESAEIYITGLRYKAPAKIDPRLLDVKHLFKEVVAPPKVIDVLRGTKQKRNREGYEEGMSVILKTCLASDFVWSDKPLELLGSVTKISFEDAACSILKEHPLTTDEIKILCDDLRVLGKQDFKNLLKWRMHLREALASQDKSLKNKTKETDKKSGSGSGSDDDDDERVLHEMGELHSILERKKKRERKLVSKRQAKTKARTRTGMQTDVTDDGCYVDQELFNLSSIKAKKQLAAVESPTQTDDENTSGEDSDYGNSEDSEGQNSDIDTDEERKRYDEQLEEILDKAYERFVVSKEGSTKQRKRAKLQTDPAKQELWQENNKQSEDAADYMDDDSDNNVDSEPNPLVLPLAKDEEPSKEQLTKQWFSQDVFAGIEDAADRYDSESDVSEMDIAQDSIAEETDKINKKDEYFSNKSNCVEDNKSLPKDDFEIVPAASTSSSDDFSSEDESDYDSDAKAEILAYAKKMLKKKQREDIIDAAYNRYTFNDENLPEWFAEEEKKHCQPLKPITKEEMEVIKAQFKEINTRPAKKVAEAKARKKRVAGKKMEAVKSKANAISNQSDISNQSKGRMIERLYKKAMPKKVKKEYVVAKKGVQIKGGGKGKVVVDRRMLKDKRANSSGKGHKGKFKGSKGRSKGKSKGKSG